VRQQYGLRVYGYVVMPEHVHLLVSEPERAVLARAMQSLKQSVAQLALRAVEPFWQARYYDFNVWSERKFSEKLRYIHRNPVTRVFVASPEEWPWSSFRHYATGAASPVEIEPKWRALHEMKRIPTALLAQCFDDTRRGLGAREVLLPRDDSPATGKSSIAPG
jgi:putative transposase